MTYARQNPTLSDCVYGQAVGDALGVPYEFMSRGSFECTGMVSGGTNNQPAGTWSDDTSMALAICDSIREVGLIDCSDIRRRFIRWYRRGSYTIDGTFGVGGTTARALSSGMGRSSERDNGNGSLMRTVPLAFTDASDDDIRAVSAITHAHPISTGACVDAVHFARNLNQGMDPVQAAATIGYENLAERPESEINSGGYVLDTLESSIWCLVTTNDYASCVLKAVNLGSDTDTTAAVAGAFAGIVYGKDAIPTEWMRTLRGKGIIECCLF